MHALQQQGMKTIEVHTVDTDVVTILVGAFFKFSFSSSIYKYLDCIWKGQKFQIL